MIYRVDSFSTFVRYNLSDFINHFVRVCVFKIEKSNLFLSPSFDEFLGKNRWIFKMLIIQSPATAERQRARASSSLDQDSLEHVESDELHAHGLE